MISLCLQNVGIIHLSVMNFSGKTMNFIDCINLHRILHLNAKRSYLTLQHCSFIPPTSRKLISPNQWMHQYVAYLAATTHDQKKILPKYFVLPKTISAKFKHIFQKLKFGTYLIEF